MSMSSSRPYLIRALYEWIVDNGCTPYILVDAFEEGVMVPQDHVNQDGQIVLNISPHAINSYSIDNTGLSFNARFGGVPIDIYVPCAAVLGIYARENQQGMVFDAGAEPEDPQPTKPTKRDSKSSTTTQSKSGSRPSLRIVK